jgi:hypothetical protein
MALKKEALGALTKSETRFVSPTEAESQGLIPKGAGTGESVAGRLRRQAEERKQAEARSRSQAISDKENRRISRQHRAEQRQRRDSARGKKTKRSGNETE